MKGCVCVRINPNFIRKIKKACERRSVFSAQLRYFQVLDHCARGDLFDAVYFEFFPIIVFFALKVTDG
jgi:hypothetical protein